MSDTPKIQFFNCDNIETFEALIAKYGCVYNLLQVYDRLIDQKNHVFAMQLMIGGYFTGMIRYATCNHADVNYGADLFIRLLEEADFERVRLFIDYLLILHAERHGLKRKIGVYHGFSEYENKIVSEIQLNLAGQELMEFKSVSPKSRIQPPNYFKIYLYM